MFDHKHFLGLPFSLEDLGEQTMHEIRLRSGVKGVWRTSKLHKCDPASDENVRQIWNPHIATGVQELHNRGITREGIVVGMIDVGINLKHPTL